MNQLSYQFIDRIKALPFVDSVWLYGSRARGENRSRSDIDLAIACPTASHEEWMQVLDIVENADTLLKIDIVRMDTLSDSQLKSNIEKDKILL